MNSLPKDATHGSYSYASQGYYGGYPPPTFYNNAPGMVPYDFRFPPNLAQYSYSAPPPPEEPPMGRRTPAPPAPASSLSPEQKQENEEVENLKRELARIKEEQRVKEERQRQEEFEKRVKEEAEQKMKQRMEEIRLAQEAARKELEEAKAEIEKAAREAIEAERQAEELRRQQEEEELEECRRIAREKLDAELRARAEWEQLKAQEAERLTREAEEKVQAKLLHEQEERRKMREEEEEKERMRQQIRDEVRAEFMKHERRYMSSSSETESFSSLSSQSSSYLSLSSTSRSRSTSSKTSARLKAPSCSSCRATKALSTSSSDNIKVLNAQVAGHGEAAPTREDDTTQNITLDPFMYLEKTSTPSPPNMLPSYVETQQSYWAWEHYFTGSMPEGARSTYADFENETTQNDQLLSFTPPDDESASSSSSGTDSDDNGSSLGIGGIFEHEVSDDEGSDTGTVIAASDEARLDPSAIQDDHMHTCNKGKEILQVQETQSNRLSRPEAGSPCHGNGRSSSTVTSDRNRPKTHEAPLKIPAQEEATLPAAVAQYLITDGNEEQQQVVLEEFQEEIDNADGGANLRNHPKQLTMSKVLPERTKNGFWTDHQSGADLLRTPSSRGSPLLPLLAKHISDFEEEVSQRNKSSNSFRGSQQSQDLKTPDGGFRPFLQEGNYPTWANKEKPSFLFPYYMGKQADRPTSSFDLRQARSTRASSSVSSDYETEVPMALVPCIMVPLNMIQSAMQGPMFYPGAIPRQDRDL